MANIPNLLTLLRIASIPLFVAIFYLPVPWSRPVCAVLFAAAALTDWLDGHLARRWRQTSPLGAFLDPVADKLIVAVALVLLVQSDPRVVLALPVALIIGREIAVSALREWMAERGARAQVAVSWAGKAKTATQMVAIWLLILQPARWGAAYDILALGLLYVAAALALWSLWRYALAAWPHLRALAPP